MKQFLKHIVVYILTLEARAVLRRYKPRIVGITGSVGKTSTKDAIYAVVAQGTHARKSEKSFNSEIGVPLTILGLPNAWENPFKWIQNIIEGLFVVLVPTKYPQWLVLEIGADRPGDIQNVAKWLKLDVAVITRLPEVPVHVEFFDSPEQVVEEKAALIKALKSGGTLVLYGDDEKTHTLRSRAKDGVETIFFGFGPKCDVRAHNFELMREESTFAWPLGMSARLTVGEESAPLSIIGTLGDHSLLPAIGAAAVGKALGKDLQNIVTALKSYEPPHGRMHLVRGIKDTLIIDDTYNSSPAALVAALETLHALPVKGRKIVALGDMTELGRHSMDEHKKVGEYVANVADLALTAGFRARGIAEGALDNGMKEGNVMQFEDSRKAGDALDDILKPGDCVLVKGSQVMRMEKIVEQIMAEPERAKELLVRQDLEWRRR
ncbi:UDP-N-acetylmuramoyl-tripeptide--D-alanyl-D-alanine ligase [Candidatus Parcubacteria bacterium]|nr:UDP-N-acetylmuramoyl-tripeptide--D-alanyl-D-alanine ligase [Candidatus Parcubacteria bacterium]